MITLNEVTVIEAHGEGKPVFFRQKGGATWGRLLRPVVNTELFEYWIGENPPLGGQDRASELDKLAERLSERYDALRHSPSDGGNPTVALSGALIAIKEVVIAIHAIKARS